MAQKLALACKEAVTVKFRHNCRVAGCDWLEALRIVSVSGARCIPNISWDRFDERGEDEGNGPESWTCSSPELPSR